MAPPSLKLRHPPPDGGSLFDVGLRRQGDGYEWVRWMAAAPPYSVPEGAAFHDIFVPTEETVQAATLVEVQARRRLNAESHLRKVSNRSRYD